MRVLIACEFSGIVRDAFIARGHDAMSCDLLPTEKPGPHMKEDIRYVMNPLRYLSEKWDLVIAHPPCTYLCNSGVRWLYNNDKSFNKERCLKMKSAAHFFRAILTWYPSKIVVENPIMHHHAKNIIGRGQDQIIQPWQFGHGETKATCLWLKGLPKLTPTKIVDGREARIHKMPPSKDRGRLRSLTYQGIADAMAEQWG